MRSSPAVFSSKFSTEPRGEPTDSGSRWTCTERERELSPQDAERQESPGAPRRRVLLAGLVLSSGRAGPSRSLRPTLRHRDLGRASARTPPRPTAEAAASWSRVAAPCRREAGRRHREGPGPGPPASPARSWYVPTYRADCERVSLEKERQRQREDGGKGPGESGRLSERKM